MPPVVAVVAAAAAKIGAVAGAVGGVGLAGVTVGGIVKGIAVSTALSFGSNLLFGSKKPNVASFGSSIQSRQELVRGTIEAWTIIYGRAKVGGTLVYAQTGPPEGSSQNRYIYYIVVLASHEIEAVEAIYFNDEEVELDGQGRVTTGDYYYEPSDTSFARVRVHLGTEDQEADTEFVDELDEWTPDHRLRGHAYLAVRFDYEQSVFPNGAPTFTAIVKGKKVYDPRDGLSKYSDNWALCVRDYLSNPDYGFAATSAEIDDNTVIAAANISDELVQLADGTTQKRYTVNGVIDTSTSRTDNLEQLKTAGAGVTPYSQGQFKVFAAAYSQPVATINEDWLVDSLTVQARPARSDLYNTVRGVYVEETRNWQPTDFPEVSNPLYVSQDNGDTLVKDIEFPFVIDAIHAQRLGKIVLEKGRQGIVVTAICNQRALPLSVWDTVYLNDEELGWQNKVFRIVSWTLTEELTIELTLNEESLESYLWNAGEATQFDPAPDTNLPKVGQSSPPGPFN